MNLTIQELRRLALPTLALVVALAAGGALLWFTQRVQREAGAELAAAKAERTQSRGRLARISEEEREVKEKLELYRRLQDQHVIGPEQRLEWADAIGRIRTGRELLDLKYRVERQRLLASVPGKPANVDVFASTMKVDIALLHEGDLLVFLGDLRSSGNALYSIQRCAISRTGQTAATAATMVPRLRAECSIDLITILDRAAKA
jgi:hypothetical protein